MTWSPLDLLPGLYVLFLAAALASALRRWLDPVPWRVLAAFLLLIAILFGPALFAGWTLLPVANVRAVPPLDGEPRVPGNWLQGDLVFQITPWILEVRRAVADGRWPLWNAGAGIGMPLLGDPQSQALQPLVWLAGPFRSEAAAGVTAALRVLTALVFTFLFLRRQGLGTEPAAAGAVTYGLGGFVLLWLGWPMGNAAALLPAALYAVERCADPGGRRDAALLCAAVAALLLGGHPETVLYSVALAGFFLLARVLSRADRQARRRLLLRAGGSFLLAGCLAAPALLPVQEYLPQTQRARVLRFQQATPALAAAREDLSRPGAWERWRERTAWSLLPVAAVRAFGDLDEFWGHRNVIEDQCGFAGAAPLLAAGAALLPLGRRRRFPHERFFAVALAVSLALIAQPPGFARLFLRLPVIGFTAVHQHHRLLLIVTFCVAVLAAAEAERWRRGEGRRAAVAVAALLLGGLIVWAYLGHPSPRSGRVIMGFLEGGMAAQLVAMGLAGALLCMSPHPRPLSRERERGVGKSPTNGLSREANPLPSPARGRGAGGEGWLLVALFAAELVLVHRYANPPVPVRAAYPVPPPVRFLQENLGTGRMVALGNCFLPNLPLVYGLRDVRIENPSQPAVHAFLTEPLNRDRLTPRFGRPRHPLYDLLGVRYVMTRPGIELPLRLAFRHQRASIWERPHALPPLFLPRRARISSEPWPLQVLRNTDFSARALVAPSPGHRKLWRSRAKIPSRVDLLSWEGARIRARADLGEPRLLATSILQDGHWHLLVDGRRVPTITANGSLVAAWLPAGRHGLELLYRPRSLLLGCALAALALAGACVLWIPPPPRVVS